MLAHGSPLLGPLFAGDAMRTLMADGARLQRMLDVEAALARAEARVGVIPEGAAGPIAAACRGRRTDRRSCGLRWSCDR